MIPTMFSGNTPYLKGDDVKSGDRVMIKTEGNEKLSTKFTHPQLTKLGKPHPKAGQPKEEFEIVIELVNGEERKMTINVTSFRSLSTSWGRDTKNWVGKYCLIEKMKLPNGKEGTFLTPSDESESYPIEQEEE